MQEEMIPIKIDALNQLALWKYCSQSEERAKHVFLTHGTFSNRKVLNGISSFLVKQGYTCWVLEWRNHGSSSETQEDFNFETVGKIDVPLALNYLFVDKKIERIDCVTHSGGGICLSIAMINNPSIRDKISSITFFACQAFGAAHSIQNRIKILIGKFIGKSLGYIPGKIVGSEENESYYLMKQWFDWNLKEVFTGEHEFDYRKEMVKISTPIFSIFGSGDKFIAPPEGCVKFMNGFKNSLNKTLCCSKENGYSENYTHSRILHSRNASVEIYPKVLAWLIENQPG